MAEDRRAISGYAFMLYVRAVSWSAKKQEIVTRSATESEYVAATHPTKEALWLRSLITLIYCAMDGPTTLFSNNQSAIALSKEHRVMLVLSILILGIILFAWSLKKARSG